MSRIKYEMQDVNLFELSDWGKMIDFIITYLPKFENAIKDSMSKLN